MRMLHIFLDLCKREVMITSFPSALNAAAVKHGIFPRLRLFWKSTSSPPFKGSDRFSRFLNGQDLIWIDPYPYTCHIFSRPAISSNFSLILHDLNHLSCRQSLLSSPSKPFPFLYYIYGTYSSFWVLYVFSQSKNCFKKFSPRKLRRNFYPRKILRYFVFPYLL